MFRTVLRFADTLFGRSRLRRVREQMAEAMVRQTKERILAGGDPDRPLAPRVIDGQKALTGEGFLNTIQSFTNDRGFGVTSTHINIRRLLLGTKGKGGSEEPIRPKKAKALPMASPSGVLFSRKSEFEPRPIFRLAPDNTKELADILAGKATNQE